MATILVIDDNPDMRAMVRAVVESAGHQAVEAADGRIGLKLYREQRPDLVICDILMPEKDGIELLRELRHIESPAPVIAISGGGRSGDLFVLQMAEKLGAAVTLQKPFRREALLEAIDRALGSPSMPPAA